MTGKSSIAFLLKYLTENTDEEHPVSSAIRQKKKIVFKYYNYNTSRKRICRHGEETDTRFPYATLWENDRYLRGGLVQQAGGFEIVCTAPAEAV